MHALFKSINFYCKESNSVDKTMDLHKSHYNFKLSLTA